jgi:hypothetical protein
VFRRAIGSLSGTSPVIAPGREFVLAGVRWSGPAAVRIELRSRRAGGAWGPWALASVLGHEPDRGGRPGHLAGEPMWLGRCDALQLRSSRPVRDLQVAFVAAGGLDPTASAAALALAGPSLPAGSGQPPIIARSAWAGSGAPPAAGPYYGAVELAFVHHTDNPNGYGPGDVPAMILAIYDYPRYTNGWFDIGYNFVIDAFGRIWEARAGGIDEPVIGAQAGGYNAVSTGIAMLGTFMFALPSAAAMTALTRLLGWKLPLHGVPVLGEVTVTVDPSSAFYTPFAPGQRVALPRIAGHRDGDLTDCPGDDLYGRLPALRGAVSGAVGASTARLTLAASPERVTPASPAVTLGGTLTRLDGTGIGEATLAIQTLSGLGEATTIARAQTDAGGRWTATLQVTGSTTVLRALHGAAPAAASDVIAIDQAPVITLRALPGSPAAISGTVTPAKRWVTLDVYRLSGVHRRLVASVRVDVRHGTFTVRLSRLIRARGRYAIIARTPADQTTVAAASAALTVTR